MSQSVDAARPVPTGARAARKRRAITDAARKVFLSEGFDATMDGIAEAADVSKATVYNHFGSKEALFVAVIHAELDRALGEARRLVEQRLASSQQLSDDLVEICRAWVLGLAAPEMIKLRNLMAGELRRFPQLGDAWQDRGPKRFHLVIAAALRSLVERRQLSIRDVDLAVLQLSGLVLSPNLVYGTFGRPLDPDLVDHLIVSGVEMFVDHYRYRANA
jgi:TetR/AcrR family transcriptional regulator, mexJK operon transcriptional repressor